MEMELFGAGLSDVVAYAVAGVFALFALVRLARPDIARRFFGASRYPDSFHRTVGICMLIAALLLSDSLTRLWGVALGAFLLFTVTVMLLERRRYIHSVPAMLMLFTLVPVAFAHPV